MTALVECSSPVHCYFEFVEQFFFSGMQYNSSLREETVSRKFKSVGVSGHPKKLWCKKAYYNNINFKKVVGPRGGAWSGKVDKFFL